MNKFADKLKSQYNVLKSSSRNEKQKKLSMVILLIVEAVIFSYMFIITFVDLSHGKSILTINIVMTALYGFSFCYVLIRKRTRLGSIITSAAMLYSFSYFFLYKYNDGVSALWIFLLPVLTMYIEGFFIGFFTCFIYFLVILFFSIFPRTREIIFENYSLIFLIRYYSIYITDLFLSTIAMAHFYIMQYDQNNYMTELAEAVKTEHDKVSNVTMQTIFSTNRLVETKDRYTGEHSSRVSKFSCYIAQNLGWSQEKIEQLKNIALLHDIGKIGVNEEILNKPEKLTDEEYEQMKKHTTIGSEILKDLTLIPNIALGAKYHHERYDGKGYPEGLKGEEIPIEARIICVADSFDAMAFKRIYRPKCDLEYIKSELIKGKGTQFDPQLIDVFLEVCEQNNWFQEM